MDDPRALADELTRSLGTMHNINLQRVDRETEGALYERLLRERYADPERIIAAAGTWEADRVVAEG